MSSCVEDVCNSVIPIQGFKKVILGEGLRNQAVEALLFAVDIILASYSDFLA
jgi:hypothetical protein